MATPVPAAITDHITRAIARLPGFEFPGTNWTKLLTALLGGVQDIEDVLDDLINEQAISTAIGTQLDNLGTILDLLRVSGQSDASYATALLGRAAALSADSGTAEQLIQTYILLWTATKVHNTDLQPATYEITAISSVTKTAAEITDIIAAMTSGKAAGVNLILQRAISPEFLFGAAANADVNGDVPISINGLGAESDADASGDIAAGVGGGNFAGVLT